MFSEVPAQHIQHFDAAFTTLIKSSMSIKIDKYQFFTQNVMYLGHNVWTEKIEFYKSETNSLQ